MKTGTYLKKVVYFSKQYEKSKDKIAKAWLGFRYCKMSNRSKLLRCPGFSSP
jgi:hypothetical protein